MSIDNCIHGDTPCPQCGKLCGWSADINYGACKWTTVLKIGQEIPWAEGAVRADLVRDSKLKYIPFDASPKCDAGHGVPRPNMMIVRKNVIAEFFHLPVVEPRVQEMLQIYCFFGVHMLTPVEKMLLIREYGCDRLADAWFNAAVDESGGKWPALAEDCSAAGNAPDAETGVRRGGLDRLRESLPSEFWPRVKQRALNRLAGRPEEYPGSVRGNFVVAPVCCPQCRDLREERIPFQYGPCAGRGYNMGERVDWKAEGWLQTVRDPELRYVEADVPACPKCMFEGVGCFSVEHDRVASFPVLSVAVLDFLRKHGSDPEARLIEMSGGETLRHQLFLLVREYGEGAVAAALAEPTGPMWASSLHSGLARGAGSAAGQAER